MESDLRSLSSSTLYGFDSGLSDTFQIIYIPIASLDDGLFGSKHVMSEIIKTFVCEMVISQFLFKKK
jgi:hypothetical protein